MPTAAVKRYWDWLGRFDCQACGAPADHIHHIMHVLRQRISKDDWLVVRLCAGCHQNGDMSVHRLGGERKVLEAGGPDLVQMAVMNRHNFEVMQR